MSFAHFKLLNRRLLWLQVRLILLFVTILQEYISTLRIVWTGKCCFYLESKMGMTPQRLLCTLKGSGSGSLRNTRPYCVLIQESSLIWVLYTTFPLLDIQKSPSSDFIWRGTKDFSHLIGASFTDGKTGRCAWTNRSSSQEPLGIELSLTRTKRIETWIAVQIPTWGQLRKRWKMLLRPRAILNCVTIKGKKLKYTRF